MFIINAYVSLIPKERGRSSEIEKISVDLPYLMDPEESGCSVEHVMMVGDGMKREVPYLILCLENADEFAVPLRLTQSDLNAVIRYFGAGGRVRIAQHNEDTQRAVELAVELHDTHHSFVKHGQSAPLKDGVSM